MKERDWLGRARTGGGNLVKAAHKGIHEEKERERRDDGRMPPSMPLLNTQVGKGVPSPDEKGSYVRPHTLFQHPLATP